MFVAICLIWIGQQLNAPFWYYLFVSITIVLKLLNFCHEISKKTK